MLHLVRWVHQNHLSGQDFSAILFSIPDLMTKTEFKICELILFDLISWEYVLVTIPKIV